MSYSIYEFLPQSISHNLGLKHTLDSWHPGVFNPSLKATLRLCRQIGVSGFGNGLVFFCLETTPSPPFPAKYISCSVDRGMRLSSHQTTPFALPLPAPSFQTRFKANLGKLRCYQTERGHICFFLSRTVRQKEKEMILDTLSALLMTDI